MYCGSTTMRFWMTYNSTNHPCHLQSAHFSFSRHRPESNAPSMQLWRSAALHFGWSQTIVGASWWVSLIDFHRLPRSKHKLQTCQTKYSTGHWPWNHIASPTCEMCQKMPQRSQWPLRQPNEFIAQTCREQWANTSQRANGHATVWINGRTLTICHFKDPVLPKHVKSPFSVKTPFNHKDSSYNMFLWKVQLLLTVASMFVFRRNRVSKAVEDKVLQGSSLSSLPKMLRNMLRNVWNRPKKQLVFSALMANLKIIKN